MPLSIAGVLLCSGWLVMSEPQERGGPAAAAPKVTIESLLREMIEIERLAELPDPPFVTRQFSSYNRASENPADPAGWFADHDRGFPLYDGVLNADTPFYKNGPMQGRPPDGVLKQATRVGLARSRPAIGDYLYVYATAADGGAIDGKIPQGYVTKSALELNAEGPVLAEMEGPGALVRIWSANPADAGGVRIYLDDEKVPVLAGKLQDLLGGEFRAPVGDAPPVLFPPPFAGQRSRGWNFCFPIPYQKRCRVVAEKGDLAYHLTYRQYPAKTVVETFTLKLLAKHAELLGQVRQQLQDRAPKFTSMGQETRSRGVEFAAGAPAELLDLEGPAAIQQLRLQLRAEPLDDALRSVVLLGWFDDDVTPKICCPVGDFFGSSPGLNPHASLPLATQGDGWHTSNWFMPFARRARFALQQHGTRAVRATLVVTTAAHEWTPRCLHFQAKWRQWQPLSPRPLRDLTLCKLEGQGVFVGEVLSVMNPVSAWWGEGDPKLYVDDEPFPSHFGTGTDDHFGLAWRSPALFQHAYHAQTRCDGPGNFGHTSLNRFRFLDRIPFTRRFRYDLEFAPWDPNAALSLATVSYWYARPDAQDDFPEPSSRQLQSIPAPPPLFRIDGAIEGEKMQVRRTSQPLPLDAQDMLVFPSERWSAGGQLWARPTRKGVWVDLEVPVAADGRYQVILHLSKGPEYGVVKFQLNGLSIGEAFDGYSAGAVRPSGPVTLGEIDLRRGTAILRIETTGTNEKSNGSRYAWGLDCVVLKRVK